MRCPCGKEFDLGPGKGHNRLFNKHCSRYCKIYFDNPDKYPNVLKSKSKHHKNQWIKPKIEVGCEACENTLLLAPYEKEGNKQYSYDQQNCSQHSQTLQSQRNCGTNFSTHR